MAVDRRDLLTVLKNEQDFLKKGGYRQAARVAWRPPFIFQDSPTCLNCPPEHPVRPCSECLITHLVPEEFQKQRIPCRYIVLDDEGRTVEWYYRNETGEELEAALAKWLEKTIGRLETEKSSEEGTTEVHVRAKMVNGT